ncbi:hypothetical protein RHMOL_Rhmol10G0160300 [Rhododendron molle]|uniref:Uncharacterized protein n=2 Tax=Rhododendron molle TaxID=49168 RepID=A0ACC0M322_RHOML|nr:hypothetical protein RHMOL_Rhmol10G0160300 [Rhododendron molle]KAI8535267.1 hypothetical protein RHMOL_Rhmol10G0160300 [Rhododendron molle]
MVSSIFTDDVAKKDRAWRHDSDVVEEETAAAEVLEVANSPHRRPVKSWCLKEEEVSDDVYITKSLTDGDGRLTGNDAMKFFEMSKWETAKTETEHWLVCLYLFLCVVKYSAYVLLNAEHWLNWLEELCAYLAMNQRGNPVPIFTGFEMGEVSLMRNCGMLSYNYIKRGGGRLKKDDEEEKEKWKRKSEHEKQWEGTR